MKPVATGPPLDSGERLLVGGASLLATLPFYFYLLPYAVGMYSRSSGHTS